jgi:hypothetical protein
MEPDREDRSAAPGWLREAWRLRSLGAGWRIPGDWDSDAVDEVLAACRNRAPASGEAGLAAVRPGALTAACAGLGRSRARDGVGIAETIDDLAALFAVLGWGEGGRAGLLAGGEGGRAGLLAGGEGGKAGLLAGGEGGKAGLLGAGMGGEPEPPLRLIGAVAEGWAEECARQLAQDGCEDPLSGLATVPYLRTRLAEVYRQAEQDGNSPAETHRLLVVRLPRRPDPWRRLAVPILIGRDLRTAFPGGETLALARAGPVIALVTVRRDLRLRYARLRRNIQATFGTQIRMTPLPGRLAEALSLVDELAR